LRPGKPETHERSRKAGYPRMTPSIFVSYSRRQDEWVWGRLVPVLRAGGAEILIDREQFEAARKVYRQMDEVQDRASLHILVLSQDYLKSKPCQHEMRRAIAQDPDFERGVAVPVLRGDCTLPAAIRRPNPIYVDLRDDGKAEQWDLLLRKCVLDLGAAAPDWLRAHDLVRGYLDRNESVNLVTGKTLWRPLLEHLRKNPALGLGVVKLDSTEAVHRPSLVEEILKQCGCPAHGPVPDKPGDLVMLGKVLKALHRAPRLALTSFDLVGPRINEYELDLFVALRYLMMDARKLTLLITSHVPIATLLPNGHPLSELTLPTVELKGRP
jgi:hypothetical protein